MTNKQCRMMIVRFALMLSLTLVLTSCQRQEAPTEVELVVLAWDERSFMDSYGASFEALHTNYKIKVISKFNSLQDPLLNRYERFQQLVETHQPDLILMDDWEYRAFVADDLLFPLSAYLNSSFDIEEWIPAVRDTLQSSDGQWYGLAPSFEASATFYNKALFDKYRIEYPHTNWTWTDLLMLASRFPGHTDGVYGFAPYVASGSLVEFILDSGLNEGFTFYDPNTRQVTLNSDGWQYFWQLALDAYRSGGIYVMEEITQAYLTNDPTHQNFLAGNVAMVMGKLGLLEKLHKSDLDWGFVSGPVNRDGRGSMILNEIYGIPVEAANKEASWELLHFINSEEVARLQARNRPAQFSSRQAFSEQKYGYNLSPFYEVKPSELNVTFDNVFYQFYEQITSEAQVMLDRVLGDELSLAEGLQELQNKGQEVLDRLMLP